MILIGMLLCMVALLLIVVGALIRNKVASKVYEKIEFIFEIISFAGYIFIILGTIFKFI